MKRIALVVGLVAAALVAASAPAGAQYGPDQGSTTTTPGRIPEITVVQGESVGADAPGAVPGAHPGTGSSLPRTGTSGPSSLVGLGAGALVLGVAFVYGSRRRRPAS